MKHSPQPVLPRWPFVLTAVGFGLLALAGIVLLRFGPFVDLWSLTHP